jgi:hypothetical protein
MGPEGTGRPLLEPVGQITWWLPAPSITKTT